jgi:GAF domain-containing protein
MDADILAELQEIADVLRAATGASRTTVRGRIGADPVALLAESLADGVESMRGGPQPGIVAAPTYVELVRTRALLVQNDCRTDGPRPPQSLIEHYRVYAQMLAPVFDDDEMIATISVHQQDAERSWTPVEIAALESVRERVGRVLR